MLLTWEVKSAMTAPQHRRPLELVPDADSPETPADKTAGPVAPTPDAESWRTESIAAQWEPEHQLVGALMHLCAQRARRILETVPNHAIHRPITRWAYEIIRTLVDADRDPDPVVVLAAAKGQPAVDALDPDQPPPPARCRQLALYLADAYTQTVSATGAASYAREVLDEAYRRAFQAHGTRMQQLGESGAPRAELTDEFTAVRDDLAELWRRAETTTQPGWDTE